MPITWGFAEIPRNPVQLSPPKVDGLHGSLREALASVRSAMITGEGEPDHQVFLTEDGRISPGFY